MFPSDVSASPCDKHQSVSRRSWLRTAGLIAGGMAIAGVSPLSAMAQNRRKPSTPKPAGSKPGTAKPATDGTSDDSSAATGTTTTVPFALGASTGLDPEVFLLRDPLVHAELKLAESSITAAIAIPESLNDRIWRLRDASFIQGSQEATEVNTLVSKMSGEILDDRQRTRLREIKLQLRGYTALLLPDMAEWIGMSDDQQSKARSSWKASEAEYSALRQEPSKQGESDRDTRLNEIREKATKKLAAVLTTAQRNGLARKQGAAIPLAQLQPMTCMAPSLDGADPWINSDPVVLSEQRGRVFAANFWAFGCINCIRNFPWYKGWAESFANENFAVVGIHTPETSEERRVETLRRKVKENEMTYPVAMDGESAIWGRWSNNVWPAVYLVDKRGLVRYWWYGELAWQGAQGEPFLRGKIQELLAEKA